jgi:hypothetical protein
VAAPVGNQNAKKAKRWQDALNKALARYESEDGKIKAGEALDKVAETVVLQALAGNKDAWQEIGNRLDGKVPQPVVGDDDAPPVTIRGFVELVRPAG